MLNLILIKPAVFSPSTLGTGSCSPKSFISSSWPISCTIGSKLCGVAVGSSSCLSTSDLYEIYQKWHLEFKNYIIHGELRQNRKISHKFNQLQPRQIFCIPGHLHRVQDIQHSSIRTQASKGVWHSSSIRLTNW